MKEWLLKCVIRNSETSQKAIQKLISHNGIYKLVNQISNRYINTIWICNIFMSTSHILIFYSLNNKIITPNYT